jgi:hypothetical protein
VIRAAGADLEVEPGVPRYLRKRVRRLRIERPPFRHTVLVKADWAHNPTEALVGKARTLHLADPETWGSPVIPAGAEVAFSTGMARNPNNCRSSQLRSTIFSTN